MAFTKIHFNDGLPHGRLLRNALTHLEQGHDGLSDVVAASTLMIDGDGSQASHFAENMTRFGTPDLATAKAMHDELASLNGKLTTDAEVTNVKAAIDQAFAKLR
jgi:hypothetical protein